jgi:hypothetical protein
VHNGPAGVLDSTINAKDTAKLANIIRANSPFAYDKVAILPENRR